MRILIVRLSALGDVIDTIPVACALRDHLPEATIAWLVEQPAHDVLAGHRAIDEIITIPSNWLAHGPERRRLSRRLRACPFDVTIDAQSLTRSAIAAWLSGARRRIGLGGRWWQDVGQWFDNELFHLIVGREASRWINNELVEVESRHVVDAYLELLRPLGVVSPTVRYDVPTDSDAVGAMGRWLGRALGGRPFAIVNPGGAKLSRVWPADRFAAVSQHLWDRHRLPVVVPWAGDRERVWATRVVDGVRGDVRLAPPTTLPELGALIRRARMFVSNDTGPLHLATAIGTPSIGLYGDLPAFRNGPYDPKHIVVEKAFKRGSIFRRRSDSNDTMLAIEIGDVCRACDRMLA